MSSDARLRKLHDAQEKRNSAEEEFMRLWHSREEGDLVRVEPAVENWDAIEEAKKTLDLAKSHLDQVWREIFGEH